jgi:hypothetical protein
MKAYESFRLLSTEEIDSFVLLACEDEEIPDKIAGAVLTYRRIPLKRLERLPEEGRKAYVRRTLRDRQAADLALFVLSAALLRGKAPLIAAFLEALGLPHDGPNLTTEGEVAQPAEKKLKAAVDGLLKQFPPRDAAIYLHAFAGQPDVSWPALDERLQSDPKLEIEDLSGS